MNTNYRNEISMLASLQKISKFLVIWSEGGEAPEVLKRVWRRGKTLIKIRTTKGEAPEVLKRVWR